MAKFKLKRTIRKEREAWVTWGLIQEQRGDALLEERNAAIEERNYWQNRAIQAERDFEIMERRYRGE